MQVHELETRLGHRWKRREVLEQALTHSSYGNAMGMPHSERLEFLGDSVLDLVTAEFLMVQYPKASEGFMSQRRSEIVKTSALARRALDLGIDQALLVGKAEYLRRVESVLADAMEAVVGALYWDCHDLSLVSERVLAWGLLQ